MSREHKELHLIYPATSPLVLMKALMRALPRPDGKPQTKGQIGKSWSGNVLEAEIETNLAGTHVNLVIEGHLSGNRYRGSDPVLSTGKWVRVRLKNEDRRKNKQVVEQFAIESGAFYRNDFYYNETEKAWISPLKQCDYAGFDAPKASLLKILGVHDGRAVDKILTQPQISSELMEFLATSTLVHNGNPLPDLAKENLRTEIVLADADVGNLKEISDETSH